MALDTAGRPTLESFRQAFRSWLRDAMPDEWRQTVFPRNWPPGDEDEAGVARSTE